MRYLVQHGEKPPALEDDTQAPAPKWSRPGLSIEQRGGLRPVYEWMRSWGLASGSADHATLVASP